MELKHLHDAGGCIYRHKHSGPVDTLAMLMKSEPSPSSPVGGGLVTHPDHLYRPGHPLPALFQRTTVPMGAAATGNTHNAGLTPWWGAPTASSWLTESYKTPQGVTLQCHSSPEPHGIRLLGTPAASVVWLPPCPHVLTGFSRECAFYMSPALQYSSQALPLVM